MLVLLFVAVGLVGCGGGDEDNEAATTAAKAAAPVTKGPGGESPTPSKDVRLTPEEVAKVKQGHYTAALLWHTQAAFTEAVTAGARDEFKRLGIDVIAQTNAEFDAAKQASDVETVLAKKPDIIVTLVIDPVSGAQAFRPAVKAGVKLVFLSNVPQGYEQGKDYVGIVTDDLAGMGKAAAELLGDAMDGKGKVGWMFHDATYYVTNQRDKAFKAWIQQKYPDIEIAAQGGVADPAKAEEVANGMLTRNPELDGIYTPWATPAEGALSALRSAGKSDAKLVTLDLDPTIALDMIQGGNTVGIAADLAYELGRTMATEGAYGVLGKNAPPFTIVPAIKVTKDNVVQAWQASLHQKPPRQVLDALR